MQPVSLLAYMTLTRAVFSLMTLLSDSTSTRPFLLTGRTLTVYPILSRCFLRLKTAGCSTSDTITSFLPPWRGGIWACREPKMAVLSDSEPQLVKMISSS